MDLYVIAQLLERIYTVYLPGIWSLTWGLEFYDEGLTPWDEEEAIRPASTYAQLDGLHPGKGLSVKHYFALYLGLFSHYQLPAACSFSSIRS